MKITEQVQLLTHMHMHMGAYGVMCMHTHTISVCIHDHACVLHATLVAYEMASVVIIAVIEREATESAIRIIVIVFVL